MNDAVLATQSLATSYNPKVLSGVAGPLGFFDPLDFAANADGPTMKRHREAELAHSRIGMLAVLGFLADEYVEGLSFLFARVSGPAISHLGQIPSPFLGPSHGSRYRPTPSI